VQTGDLDEGMTETELRDFVRELCIDYVINNLSVDVLNEDEFIQWAIAQKVQ
jgi:hypothetical protein